MICFRCRLCFRYKENVFFVQELEKITINATLYLMCPYYLLFSSPSLHKSNGAVGDSIHGMRITTLSDSNVIEKKANGFFHITLNFSLPRIGNYYAVLKRTSESQLKMSEHEAK